MPDPASSPPCPLKAIALRLDKLKGDPVQDGQRMNELTPRVEEDMLSAIMQYTGVPSLTGLPSLAVPCGFDPDGLPIGMQIIGKPFDEATLFRVGAAYQSATDFHTRAPTL